MSQRRQARALRETFGDLIARHESTKPIEWFREHYWDDPVGFAWDVVGIRLWSKQRHALEMLRDNRFTSILSANGVGKTVLAAVAVLWWLYARGPSQVLSMAAVERQVRDQLWRHIRAMWLAAEITLPGELLTMGIVVSDRERWFAKGTAISAGGKITGYHHPRLLVVIDEAHGLEPWAWQDVHTLPTATDNKLLAIGNPFGEQVGTWYDATTTAPRWAKLQISGLEHPNLTGEETRIPGAITREMVEDIKAKDGEASPFYAISVLGIWPESSTGALFERRDFDGAFRLYSTNDWAQAILDSPPIISIDPAYTGQDETAVVVRKGPVVREIQTWRGLDTTSSLERFHKLLRRYRVRPRISDRHKVYQRAYGRIVVDLPGLGAAIFDPLNAEGYAVIDYNGGRTAPRHPERFYNFRAWSFFQFRDLLRNGEIGLPYNEGLLHAALAVRWGVNPKGQNQVERKEVTKGRMGGGGYDTLDAVVMAFAHRWGGVRTGRSLQLI